LTAFGARGGFTLIETIVTLLIVGIAISISITFLTTGSNFLNRTEENASNKALAEHAADFIRDRLLYAREVRVVSASKPPSDTRGGEILFIGGDGGTKIANTGRLYYWRDGAAPVDILGAGLYRNSELALSYTATITESAIADGAFGSTKAAIFDVEARAVRDGRRTQGARQTFRMYNIGPDSEPKADRTITSWDAGDPGHGERFYLYISPALIGYVEEGLVARFDAVDNSLDAQGKPYHSPSLTGGLWKDISGNGNDTSLTFTDNISPIREKSIYFDGNGDYGLTTANLDLSAYDEITVEVCFRVAPGVSPGALFEHTPNGDSYPGAFGLLCNSKQLHDRYTSGMMHTNLSQGIASPDRRPANYEFENQTETFQTHSNVFVLKAGAPPRESYVDGMLQELNYEGDNSTYLDANTPFSAGSKFANAKFYVANRNTNARFFNGEIASLRIYTRRLNADEIKRNADEDQIRFNS
jgi:prepilin-type N-terminal cleavage/methylation domain-containing protein